MAIKGTVQIGGEQTPVPNFNALLAPIQNQMAQNNHMRMAQAMKNMDRQYAEQESIRREGRQANYAREARVHVDTLATERSRYAEQESIRRENRQENRLIEREGRHATAGLLNTEKMASLNYRLQDDRQRQILIKNIHAMAEKDPNLFEGIQGALNNPFLISSLSTPKLHGIFDQMSGSAASRDEYRDSYQQYQQSSPADRVAAGAAFTRDPQDLRYPHTIGDGGHTPYVNSPGMPPLPDDSPRSNANLGAQGIREVDQLNARRNAAIPAFHKSIREAYSALGRPFDAETLIQNSNVHDLQNLDSELQRRIQYHGELARLLSLSGHQSDPHTFNDISMEELEALLYQPGATGDGRDAFRTYASMPTNPGIPAAARSLPKLREQYETQQSAFVGINPYRKFAGDWRADTAIRDHAESLDTYRGELEALWRIETTKSKKVISELEGAAIRAYKEGSLDFEDDDSSKPTKLQDQAPQPGTPEARAITFDYLFREGNAATVEAWKELSTENPNSKLVVLKDRYTQAYATARGALLQAKGNPALWAQLRPETQKMLRMALLGRAYTSTGTVQAKRPRR